MRQRGSGILHLCAAPVEFHVAEPASLSGAQVKALVRGIASGLKQGSEAVYRVDIVPIGGPPALP